MYFLIALAGIAFLAFGIYVLCSEPIDDNPVHRDDLEFWGGVSAIIGLICCCLGIVGMLA